MWNRRYICDVRDLESGRIQRTDRSFPAWSRPLDEDIEILHPEIIPDARQPFGRDLRGERRALARTSKSAAASCGPRQRVPLPVSNRDYGVVKRSVNVSFAIHNHALCALFSSCRRCRHNRYLSLIF